MWKTPFLLLIITIFPSIAPAAVDNFVYGGCTQVKYAAGSTYESNVNSLLTTLVYSASSTLYTNSTSSLAGSPPLYGLFQCRGDLSTGDCARCVSRAVDKLGTLCSQSAGGAIQLDGCFVKYDNATFLGVDDKTLVLKKCGAPTADEINNRDSVLNYLTAGAGGAYNAYRVGGSGDVHGVAQCVQDLGEGQCQDCLDEAASHLKSECGASASGDVYLAKCYVRLDVGTGAQSSSDDNNDDNQNDDEVEKTLAILIGLIAGVALLIVFLSFLRNVCGKEGK